MTVSQGKYKKCKCIDQFDIDVHPVADGQLKAQQDFLASVAALPAPTKTEEAWCVWMAFKHATPTAWCECAKGSSTFAVATGTATAAGICPYTKAPGDQITVKTDHGGPTSTSANPQPTLSAERPFCYRDGPDGDIMEMRERVENFCKGIKDDMIQTGFSEGPTCSAKLAGDVWIELSLSASYHDLDGDCPQGNFKNLETSPDKCKAAMTEAILCKSSKSC